MDASANLVDSQHFSVSKLDALRLQLKPTASISLYSPGQGQNLDQDRKSTERDFYISLKAKGTGSPLWCLNIIYGSGPDCLRLERRPPGDQQKERKGRRNAAERNVAEDLLSFVGHHRQGHVLAHEVQLVGQTVGPRDVDGGAVVIALPHYMEHRRAFEEKTVDFILLLILQFRISRLTSTVCFLQKNLNAHYKFCNYCLVICFCLHFCKM